MSLKKCRVQLLDGETSTPIEDVDILTSAESVQMADGTNMETKITQMESDINSSLNVMVQDIETLDSNKVNKGDVGIDILFTGTVGLKDSIITLSESISNYSFLMIYTSAKGLGCEIMQTDLEGSYVIRESDIQNSVTNRVVTFYELGLSKTSDKELTVSSAYKMEDANGVYTKEEGTADKNVNDFLRIYKIVGVK